MLFGGNSNVDREGETPLAKFGRRYSHLTPRAMQRLSGKSGATFEPKIIAYTIVPDLTSSSKQVVHYVVRVDMLQGEITKKTWYVCRRYNAFHALHASLPQSASRQYGVRRRFPGRGSIFEDKFSTPFIEKRAKELDAWIRSLSSIISKGSTMFENDSENDPTSRAFLAAWVFATQERVAGIPDDAIVIDSEMDRASKRPTPTKMNLMRSSSDLDTLRDSSTYPPGIARKLEVRSTSPARRKVRSAVIEGKSNMNDAEEEEEDEDEEASVERMRREMETLNRMAGKSNDMLISAADDASLGAQEARRRYEIALARVRKEFDAERKKWATEKRRMTLQIESVRDEMGTIVEAEKARSRRLSQANVELTKKASAIDSLLQDVSNGSVLPCDGGDWKSSIEELRNAKSTIARLRGRTLEQRKEIETLKMRSDANRADAERTEAHLRERIEAIETEKCETHKRVDELTSRVAELRVSLETTERAAEALRTERSALIDRYAVADEKCQVLSAEIDRRKTQHADDVKHLKDAETQILALTTQLASLTEDKARAAKEMEARLSALNNGHRTDVADRETKFETALAALKREQDAEIRTMIKHEDEERRDLVHQRVSEMKHLQDTRTQIVSLESQLASMSRENTKMKSETEARVAALNDDHRANVASCEARFEAARAEMRLRHDEILAEKQKHAEGERDLLKRQLNDLVRQLECTLEKNSASENASNRRIHELKDIIERLRADLAEMHRKESKESAIARRAAEELDISETSLRATAESEAHLEHDVIHLTESFDRAEASAREAKIALDMRANEFALARENMQAELLTLRDHADGASREASVILATAENARAAAEVRSEQAETAFKDLKFECADLRKSLDDARGELLEATRKSFRSGSPPPSPPPRVDALLTTPDGKLAFSKTDRVDRLSPPALPPPSRPAPISPRSQSRSPQHRSLSPVLPPRDPPSPPSLLSDGNDSNASIHVLRRELAKARRALYCRSDEFRRSVAKLEATRASEMELLSRNAALDRKMRADLAELESLRALDMEKAGRRTALRIVSGDDNRARVRSLLLRLREITREWKRAVWIYESMRGAASNCGA